MTAPSDAHPRPRPLEPGLRSVLAGNPGPFTLDGTLTYLVGERRVAVVDPGPDLSPHLDALARALEGAESVVLLITHAHLGHAGGAAALARGLGARVLGAGPVDERLGEGAPVETDAGELVAVETPGHAHPHLSFHWAERGALFAGDLVLGRGETTLVAGYPGCVSHYLASLARVLELGLRRLYPAHGPPIDAVAERRRHFAAHRRARIAQVRELRASNPTLGREEILARVYGDTVPPGLERAALASVDAILDHLAED